MGEIADEMVDRYYGMDDIDFDDGPISHYFDLSDDELRKLTSKARDKKIVGIRNWPNKLSDKQRYCLAEWLANRGNE